MRNQWLIVIILILALAGTGISVWYFFFKTEIEPVKPVETTEEALEVLSQTPPVTVETNPVKNVPDLNPVEKINPFKTANPFE